jgi:hypothetical protein
LRRYNLYNTLTKEVFGSNFPHVLGVMNFNEFVDQAINQFGNTLGVGLGGLAADRLIDKAFLALHPTVFKAGPTQAQRTLQSNPATHPHAQAWYELGKSAAVYATIATFLIANPFIATTLPHNAPKPAVLWTWWGWKTTTPARKAHRPNKRGWPKSKATCAPLPAL